MDKQIPKSTVEVFARSIVKEALKYGFKQLDIVRLVNELLDSCSGENEFDNQQAQMSAEPTASADEFTSLPLIGKQLMIRAFDITSDVDLLEEWLPDKYGRYFVLSCATAQSVSLATLVQDNSNHFGIITSLDAKPIGALAFLDHSTDQKRAELRKLIGDPESRGKGLAEEATRLWISYGKNALGLEKIYVSTLQTHINNIKLNENVGFQVEGILRNEVLIDGDRHDLLRMGICLNQSI